MSAVISSIHEGRRVLLRRRLRFAQQRERGSITVMTLIGIGVILGAFLYVAVIAGRASETVRVRTSADATALAAATVKARTLNYAAFLFLDESVLFPLAQVSFYITAAQVAAHYEVACALLLMIPGLEEEGTNCMEHLIGTAVTSKLKWHDVSEWLDTIESTAEALDEVGPLWAEIVAMQTGTAAAYGEGGAAVDVAAAFPLAEGGGQCGALGIEMVDNITNVPDVNESACSVESKWEPLYAAMGLNVIESPLDVAAWVNMDSNSACGWFGPPLNAMCKIVLQYPEILLIVYPELMGDPVYRQFITQKNINRLIVQAQVIPRAGVQSFIDFVAPNMPCINQNKAPRLADDWQDHSRSIGLSLISQPSDARLLSRLFAFSRDNKSAPATAGPPGLLGMACAAHYSQDHIGTESLWHMDWRARLVPCDFAGGDAKLIESCSSGDPLSERFRFQMGLGIARDWVY